MAAAEALALEVLVGTRTTAFQLCRMLPSVELPLLRQFCDVDLASRSRWNCNPRSCSLTVFSLFLAVLCKGKTLHNAVCAVGLRQGTQCPCCLYAVGQSKNLKASFFLHSLSETSFQTLWCPPFCLIFWVGDNIIRSFSFLYIAASHMAHVHYLSYVYIVSCYIIMYFFLEHVTFDIFVT